jgi:hypothetical protein
VSSSALSLRPVTLRLPRGSGALRAQIETALAAEGQPLRWAITAVEPAADPEAGPGGELLSLDVVPTVGVVLTIEAVVLA